MPAPDHDLLVKAFTDLGGREHRRNAYTHIHGPNQPIEQNGCTRHSIIVEHHNGTVSIRKPAGLYLGGAYRPNLPIREHPLGSSSGAIPETFRHAFEAHEILAKWGSFGAFAADVIQHEQKVERCW